MDEQEQLLNYALNQTAQAAHLAIQEGEIHEALLNTGQWALVAYERLLEQGVPAINATSMIIGTVHGALTAKLLEPPTA